jgi:hypothetical protein
MFVNQTFDKQTILYVCQNLFLMSFFSMYCHYFKLPFCEFFKSHLQLGHILLFFVFVNWSIGRIDVLSIQIKVSIDIVRLIIIIGYKLEIHVCGQQRAQVANACCFDIFAFVILPSVGGVPMC